MNLEEFKKQMNTEAQERCNQQEKTIIGLHEQIKGLQHTVKIMQNRCHAQTLGMLCMFCSYQRDGSCTSFTREGREVKE